MTTPSASLIHQVLVYEDAKQFLAEIVPFVQEGIDRGEPILTIATEANTSALRGALGSSAADVRFVEPAHWYDSPGRTMAACYRYLQESRDGHERVRVIGEPVWTGTNPLETAGWKRFEASLNLAFAASPAWMICSYDRRSVPAAVVADARRTHPELYGGHKSADFTDLTDFFAELDTNLDPAPEGAYTSAAFDGDPAPVRRFAAEQAAWLGMSAPHSDDLVLAVNEVTTNAIRHGAGHGRVRIWREDRHVVCEVFDPGHAKGVLTGFVPPDPTSEGGHGLWITRQLCDLVEIRTAPAGTTVRLYVRV
jgi:anti-sigma regulatory factor (Ser/Thr protein kinase)